VLLSNSNKRRIAGDPAKGNRTIGRDRQAVPSDCRQETPLVEVWVILNLRGSDGLRRDTEGFLEIGNGEIRQADVPRHAQALGLAQGAHAFCHGDCGIGPVDEQEIDAGAQAPKAFLDGILQRSILDELGPNLGGDKDFIAIDTRGPDAFSDCGFIVIPLGCVDMTKTEFQGFRDNFRALLATQLKCAAPQFRNARPAGSHNYFHRQHLLNLDWRQPSILNFQ
jgi:hypothetical protein